MTNDRKARAQRAEAMRKEREKADRRQRSIISVAIVAIVVVLIGVGGWAIKNASDANESETQVIEPRNITEGGVDFVPSTEPESPAENPVLVETFEDFLCPGCAFFDQSVSPWLESQAETGRIQLRFMPYSFLDAAGASTNEYSQRAMNIAMCALDEGGPEDFWPVKAALFAAQPSEGGAGPDDAALQATAEAAGVTVSDECVRTGRFIPWINEAREQAKDDRGVTGTPTIFVAGEVIQGPEQNGRGTIPTQADLEPAIAAAE